MRLLGVGELAGLHARGIRKQERDPILRNARIREETQRAHMRALIAIPPAKFPELRRIERFHIDLTRVAPAQQQLAEDELHGALEPVRAGLSTHLGDRITFELHQAVGPWAVRFTVHDDSPVADCTDSLTDVNHDVDPEDL